VRLTELHRTTGFRVATRFLALFGFVALVLFGYLYREITGFEMKRIDDWLVREHAALVRESTPNLMARLEHQDQFDPRHQRPFGLFDANGRHLAGGYHADQPRIPFYDKPFSMRLEGLPGDAPGRCIAARLPEERIGLQCQSGGELDHFHEELLRALLSAAALTLVLGLVGAVLVGLGSMRRLDAVTTSIKEIVAGNLSRRLPVHSKEDDLDRLVGVVNGMLDEIERLMHEVKGVCDAIAHDLRSPLTRLIAGLERAQRRARTEAQYRATIEETVIEAGSILRTFNALLRISEIGSGVRREHFVSVDLLAVAHDVFEFYEPTAEEKRIAFELKRSALERLDVLGDPSLLFDALANIVENAIKFAPPGGAVTITPFRDTIGSGIRVRDNGPGIAPSERQAVLRRFYRGEASRHTPGSGLGLSLVQAVSAMHGMALQFSDITSGCEVVLFRPAEER
jgi:signal transduction histidine kinase